MTGSRHVHLVRHGETVGRSAERFFGATDIELSDEGRAQVRALAPLLVGQRYAALLHSPLQRAAESARLLLGALAAAPALVEAVEGFREVDFGLLEGLTEAEIASRHAGWYETWKSGAADRYPGGEPFAGFGARVADAFEHALARHPHGDLLLVAHKGVIKRILMHVLGTPWAEVRPLPLDLASRSILRVGPDGFTLVEWNRLP